MSAVAHPVTAGGLLWAMVVTTFVCIPLGVSLWAFLDATHRPQWAWALSPHRQVVWMVGILFGTCTVAGGLILSAWYLARVRPAIAAIEAGDLGRAAPPPASPGSPPPGSPRR